MTAPILGINRDCVRAYDLGWGSLTAGVTVQVVSGSHAKIFFEPGELVFVGGGNGSGKSTLAKIITGLYTPESGFTRANGRTITDASPDDKYFHVADRIVKLDYGQLNGANGAAHADFNPLVEAME